MDFKSSNAIVLHAQWRTSKVALMAIVLGIFGSTIAGIAGAQSRELSQELRAKVNKYIASWDTHDAAVLAGHFTFDADMIMGNEPILGDRPAIQGWWRDYFAVQEPGRGLTIEVLSARAITSDVALLNVRTTTGGRTPQGLELPARKARGTWVLVRQEGNWLISAMRGMPTEQDHIIRGGG